MSDALVVPASPPSRLTARQIVVQMHGEPGSGKSTVARAIAPHLNAVVLDKDVIKAALLRSGIEEAQAASGAYEAYFALARSIVDSGHSLILDNPAYWPRVLERWHDVATAARCPTLMLHCVCDDTTELRRRLATRDALESQPREPLDLRRHPGTIEVDCDRLVLNTTRPLADIVGDAFAYIEAAVQA